MTRGEALARDHALLCRAVRDAGAIALDYFRRGFDVREKSPGDPVTDADLAVDDALRSRLAAARPDYGWLSEETEDDGSRLSAARVWVVDPIDGTRGFVAGNREWAVSAALVEAGRPVAGCVYNPAADAFYDAREGGGARRNGEAVRVAAAGGLAGATLASSRADGRRARWRERFPRTGVRRVDAVAWRLALVADGSVDGAVALRPKSDWDIAAGDLLVREAGGGVTDLDGETMLYNRERANKPGLVAAGPTLRPLLVARLAAS